MSFNFNTLFGKFLGYFGLCFLLTVFFATTNSDAHPGSEVWHYVIGHMVLANFSWAISLAIFDRYSIHSLISNSFRNIFNRIQIRQKNQ